MKTLPKEITRSFFINGQKSYDELELRWKKHIYSFEGTDFDKSHFLLYQILRGKELNKSFVFPTNELELKNGRQKKISTYIVANAPYNHPVFKDLIKIHRTSLYRILDFKQDKVEYKELEEIKELLKFQ